MKKSTNESPEKPADSEREVSGYQPPLIWEIAVAEGGIAVLIVYPLVVLFFLKMAYNSFR